MPPNDIWKLLITDQHNNNELFIPLVHKYRIPSILTANAPPFLSDFQE